MSAGPGAAETLSLTQRRARIAVSLTGVLVGLGWILTANPDFGMSRRIGSSLLAHLLLAIGGATAGALLQRLLPIPGPAGARKGLLALGGFAVTLAGVVLLGTRPHVLEQSYWPLIAICLCVSVGLPGLRGIQTHQFAVRIWSVLSFAAVAVFNVIVGFQTGAIVWGICFAIGALTAAAWRVSELDPH